MQIEVKVAPNRIEGLGRGTIRAPFSFLAR